MELIFRILFSGFLFVSVSGIFHAVANKVETRSSQIYKDNAVLKITAQSRKYSQAAYEGLRNSTLLQRLLRGIDNQNVPFTNKIYSAFEFTSKEHLEELSSRYYREEQIQRMQILILLHENPKIWYNAGMKEVDFPVLSNGEYNINPQKVRSMLTEEVLDRLIKYENLESFSALTDGEQIKLYVISSVSEEGNYGEYLLDRGTFRWTSAGLSGDNDSLMREYRGALEVLNPYLYDKAHRNYIMELTNKKQRIFLNTLLKETNLESPMRLINAANMANSYLGAKGRQTVLESFIGALKRRVGSIVI